MTCEHVIQKEIIEKEPIEFEIFYFYENYSKRFSFKKSERFIKEYMSDFNIDVTLIEIKADEIPAILFLEPDYDNKNYKRYINSEIIIHQFPRGFEQCVSQGKIINIQNKKIVHESSSESGSSGSPIILKNNPADTISFKNKPVKPVVIGIHKAGNKGNHLNYGNLIFDVIKDVEKIKNVDYILEENVNGGFNFTAHTTTVSKTIDSRKYNRYPYEILLKKSNEKVVNLSIKNIEDNISFSKRIENKNFEKVFNDFDFHIYYLECNENNDHLIITSSNDRSFQHQLDKKKESNENYIIAQVSVEVPKKKN
jgi:hypothetical protein